MGEEIKYSSSAKITQQRRLKIQLSLPTAWRLENLLARFGSTWFPIICAAICSYYTYGIALAAFLEESLFRGISNYVYCWLLQTPLCDQKGRVHNMNRLIKHQISMAFSLA